MARSDLIINLAKAGAHGDHVAFRRTLEAIVADERGRQHTVLAERLAEFLSPAPLNGNGHGHSASGSGDSLLHEVRPRRILSDLVLKPDVRSACDELVEEQRRADLLRSHNLEPRHRVLLAGEPGNGKTALAEAIAGELAAPLLVVRYESVIGSYLGETATRLALLFDHVRTRRCVLFFDEFDAIGKERGDAHETGEIKRVVSSLLLNVDALPSYVVAVAATNHSELLDRAVWRRFQLRLELPRPGRAQVIEWIERFEERAGIRLGFAPRTLADRLKGLSYAELEQFCLDIQRRLVLAGLESDVKAITGDRLKQWSARHSTGT